MARGGCPGWRAGAEPGTLLRACSPTPAGARAYLTRKSCLGERAGAGPGTLLRAYSPTPAGARACPARGGGPGERAGAGPGTLMRSSAPTPAGAGARPACGGCSGERAGAEPGALLRLLERRAAPLFSVAATRVCATRGGHPGNRAVRGPSERVAGQATGSRARTPLPGALCAASGIAVQAAVPAPHNSLGEQGSACLVHAAPRRARRGAPGSAALLSVPRTLAGRASVTHASVIRRH